jgi:hypothetical protein
MLKNHHGDSAVWYTYNENKNCIYLPVVNKFKKDIDCNNFQLLINPVRWKGFGYIITGILNQTISEDDIDFSKNDLIKNKKFSEENVNLSLFDQRNNKLMKNNHKLIIKTVTEMK